MKRLFFLVILVLFCVRTGLPQNTQRPKVAVVLSGGGAKGFAHIGVLKVLEEEGIPIDIIVGTSMGSIVGGLYSIGYSADSIASLARSSDWTALLSDDIPRRELDINSRIEKQRYLLHFPLKEGNKPAIPNGVIKGQNIINLFCGLAANVPEDADFTKFPVAFACVGTDLATGEEIVLKSGFLPTAMFSSMAIPGAFVPGEHNGHMLVDGGLVNNFPADVAKSMGADIIIGVDVTNQLHPEEELGSISGVVDQLVNFYILRKNSSNRSLCNIIIHPNTEGYSVSSFKTQAVDSLINRGIAAAREETADIVKLKSEYNFSPEPVDQSFIKTDKWQINEVTFSGKYSMSKNFLYEILEMDTPEQYSFDDIKNSINHLYGTGNFKRAYFRMEENGRGRNLDITLDENKKHDFNVGMRLNSSSAVSIVLNSTRKDYMKTFGLVSLSADISFNPEVNLLLEMDKKDMAKLSLEINAMYKQFDVHLNKEDNYPTDLMLASAKLFVSERAAGNSMAGSGIKQAYYYGRLYSLVNDSLPVITTRGKSITSLYIFLSHDNLDDYYFPTKGSEFYFEMSVVPQKDFQNISTFLLFKDRTIIRFNSSISALLNCYGRSILSEASPGQLGNFVGGHDYEISLDNNLPFYGLPPYYTTKRQTFIGLLGLRANITGKHYLTAVGNLLLHSAEFYPLSNFNVVSGYGLTYSYDSPVGPLEVTAGYSSGYKSPTLSANLGLWF